jgi:hypothetical protein
MFSWLSFGLALVDYRGHSSFGKSRLFDSIGHDDFRRFSLLNSEQMVASAKNHTVSLPPHTNTKLVVQLVPSTIQNNWNSSRPFLHRISPNPRIIRNYLHRIYVFPLHTHTYSYGIFNLSLTIEKSLHTLGGSGQIFRNFANFTRIRCRIWSRSCNAEWYL